MSEFLKPGGGEEAQFLPDSYEVLPALVGTVPAVPGGVWCHPLWVGTKRNPSGHSTLWGHLLAFLFLIPSKTLVDSGSALPFHSMAAAGSQAGALETWQGGRAFGDEWGVCGVWRHFWAVFPLGILNLMSTFTSYTGHSLVLALNKSRSSVPFVYSPLWWLTEGIVELWRHCLCWLHRWCSVIFCVNFS